jgi:transcriptional regulator with XRE-family HTH domain
VNGEHQAFGLRLKGQRDRRGITLESIAETTKIKRSLLASLERGDVTGWPLGIFRRAFVRSYAEAIGLPAAATVAEFVRLFPEPGEEPSSPREPAAAGVADGASADADPSLRLTLAADAARWLPRVRDRVSAAAIDGLTIFAIALTLWVVRASSLSLSLGLAAFGFVIAQGLSSGRSSVTRWVKVPAGDAAAETSVEPEPVSPPAAHQPRGRRNPSRPASVRHGQGARRERVRRTAH